MDETAKFRNYYDSIGKYVIFKDTYEHLLLPAPPAVVLFEKDELPTISKEYPNYSPIELGYEIVKRFTNLHPTIEQKYVKMADEGKYDPNEFSCYKLLYNAPAKTACYDCTFLRT